MTLHVRVLFRLWVQASWGTTQVLFRAFKNINKFKSTLITQARPIWQKSRYMILLIYMWKWAFMEEWKRTAGKGVNGVQ